MLFITMDDTYMKKEKNKVLLLESNLLAALHNIDTQIARAMQRTPQELEQYGVQKWDLYTQKIEEVSQIILTVIGENRCQLDGILVLAQALAKSLYLLVEELGEENLGKIRFEYCKVALEKIERDARQGLSELNLQHAQ